MTRLWVEFLSLYAVLPLFLAIALPLPALFPCLYAATAVALILLATTPGFRWRELLRGSDRIGWARGIILTLATAVVSGAILLATQPAALLILPREAPWLLVVIVVFYPPLSVLPQELVYRPLFFRRYSALLPRDPRRQVLVNATLFAGAHLMYWDPIVLALTFVGGVVFAWSYRIRGNFPEAVLLHSAVGIAIFAMGLGTLFYTGDIRRPF